MPLGHAVHDDAPPVEYVFAGHERHEPASRKLPAEHEHAEEEVEPAGAVAPLGHAVHEVAEPPVE